MLQVLFLLKTFFQIRCSNLQHIITWVSKHWSNETFQIVEAKRTHLQLIATALRTKHKLLLNEINPTTGSTEFGFVVVVVDFPPFERKVFRLFRWAGTGRGGSQASHSVICGSAFESIVSNVWNWHVLYLKWGPQWYEKPKPQFV